jgi:hypothetical protein
MSKKDEVTRKWRNYIMRKLEEISEYNGCNRIGIKTQNTSDEYKYTNINIKNFLLRKIITKLLRKMPFTLKLLYPSYHFSYYFSLAL